MNKISGFFRGLSKAMRLFFLIGTLLSILIGTTFLFSPTTVQAIINRALGLTVPPGEGLYDRGDSLHVLTDWTMQINDDSTGIDTTNLWTLMAMGRVESTWIADGGIGAADLHANAVGNAQCEQIDSAWITDGSIGTSTIRNGGIWNEDLADDAVGNAECQAIDSAWITDGSIGTSTIKDGGIFTGDVADQTLTKADIDTTASNFVFNDAYRITSATADSAFMTKGYIDAVGGGGAIHDSLWTFDQFYDGFDISFRTGSEAITEITVYDNLANDSAGHFVRHVHTGTTAGKKDTVVASCKLPMGIDGDGIDSLTYQIRTSHVADSVYVQIKVWKRTTELGALVFCDSVAATATTTGAWEHKTTGAFEAAANAGNELEVWFIVTFPSQTANIVLTDHKSKPRAWYTGK